LATPAGIPARQCPERWTRPAVPGIRVQANGRKDGLMAVLQGTDEGADEGVFQQFGKGGHLFDQFAGVQRCGRGSGTIRFGRTPQAGFRRADTGRRAELTSPARWYHIIPNFVDAFQEMVHLPELFLDAGHPFAGLGDRAIHLAQGYGGADPVRCAHGSPVFVLQAWQTLLRFSGARGCHVIVYGRWGKGARAAQGNGPAPEADRQRGEFVLY
jgi:hypothetical protein